MDYLQDAEEALHLAQSWVTQGQRELAAAEAMVSEGKDKVFEKQAALAAALDILAAKELIYERRRLRGSIALLGVPEPYADL